MAYPKQETKNLTRISVELLTSLMMIGSLLFSPAPTALAGPAGQIPRTFPHYAFDIRLDYAGHRLDATMQVSVPNTFGEPISNILFNVPAAHTPGVLELHGVSIDDRPITYDFSGTTLTIDLPAPLRPGETITLTMDFSVNIPPLSAESFAGANLAFTADATNVGYWYPLLAPYRRELGWLSVPWYPIGDPFATDTADYTATITTDPGLTIVSGGNMSRAGGVWRVDLPRARTFAFIASPNYHETTATLGGVTYSIYTFAQHAYIVPAALSIIVRAKWLYTWLYGPYPYSTLRTAEVTGPWSMEFSGFFTLGETEYDSYDGTDRNRLFRFAPHEVSHQWWYSVVGDDQTREPWLDEGIARFNELRFYEAYAPQDVQWWWDQVVGYGQPTRAVNSALSDFQSHSSYLTNVYNQGAMFLDALRTAMGQAAFDAFMRDLYRRGSFNTITTQDFLSVFTAHAEIDLGPIIRRYLSAN